MIHFIKKELIIFIISLTIFGGAFYIYQNQDTNISSQKEEVQMTKTQIQREKTKLKKILKEYKKEKIFEQEIFTEKKLKVIPSYKKTFDIFKVRKEFKDKLNTIFGPKNFSLKFETKPKRAKFRKYIVYPVTISLNYLNTDSIKLFFDWINSKYFYSIKSLNYKADKGKGTLTIKINLLGKR